VEKIWARHPMLITVLIGFPSVTLLIFLFESPNTATMVTISIFVVLITLIFTISLYKLEKHNHELNARAVQKAAEITRLQLLNQRIIDVTTDGIIAADRNDRVISCNPAARKLLNSADVQYESISPHILFHQGQSCNQQCEILDAVHHSSKGSHLLDLVIDGENIVLDVTVRPLDGPESGYVIIFHDVTAQALLSRTKEHIISVVSHEIRTPLTTMRGSLGLLKSGLFGAITDESKDLLGLAIENSERLMILVNDLLDLDKIASKRNHLKFQRFYIDELIAQTVRQISVLSNRKNIVVSISSKHEEVVADRDRLLQVLSNLLHNSIKFSPDESKIEVIAFSRDNEYVVQVKDEGKGVPDNQLLKIFEPFTQLSTYDSRSNDGSGLGLSICKGIIDSHGGKINAINRNPHGCIFEFSIPHSPSVLQRERERERERESLNDIFPIKISIEHPHR
jgi:signal transduction histidine kinase